MKNVFTPISSICFAIIMFTACSKSDTTEETNNCKTCRAFASTDAPPAEQRVCSEAEEAEFRSEHKQQEISCN